MERRSPARGPAPKEGASRHGTVCTSRHVGRSRGLGPMRGKLMDQVREESSEERLEREVERLSAAVRQAAGRIRFLQWSLALVVLLGLAGGALGLYQAGLLPIQGLTPPVAAPGRGEGVRVLQPVRHAGRARGRRQVGPAATDLHGPQEAVPHGDQGVAGGRWHARHGVLRSERDAGQFPDGGRRRGGVEPGRRGPEGGHRHGRGSPTGRPA